MGAQARINLLVGQASMQKFFEATCWSRDQGEASSEQYAVLRQQTASEISLAKWHSSLDRAVAFLQRDVGYSLLDDARSENNGEVSIRRPKYDARFRRKERALRFPKTKSALPTRSVLEKSWEVHDGSDSDCERSASTRENLLTEQMRVYLLRYGVIPHYPDDLTLAIRFSESIGGREDDKMSHVLMYKTVLEGLGLLHQCQFDYADVVLCLAYASVYFRTIFRCLGDKMNANETAHVSVLLIYLAHCFLLDVNCPLRCWQQSVFRTYCSLKVLDAALFRLFETQNFSLMLSQEEEREALRSLLGLNRYMLVDDRDSAVRSTDDNTDATLSTDVAFEDTS